MVLVVFLKVIGSTIRGMDKASKYSRMVTAILVNMIWEKYLAKESTNGPPESSTTDYGKMVKNLDMVIGKELTVTLIWENGTRINLMDLANILGLTVIYMKESGSCA